MQKLIPVKHLPPEIAAELGQLIPLWTILFWQFVTLACLILNINHKDGRIVLREPRIDEYVSAIEDLCTVRKIKTPTKLAKLKAALHKYEEKRNLYTHGLWLWAPESKQLFVRLTKGNWSASVGKKSQKVKRRITPEAVPVTAYELKQLRRDIDKAISEVGNATREIESELSSLRNK